MTVAVPVARVKPAVSWLIGQAKNLQAVTGHVLYVGYGEPVNDDPDDQIYLATEVHDQVKQIGMTTATAAGPVQEAFAIALRVSVFRSGGDGQDAFERCADLVDSLVAFVRADQTMGGNVAGAEVADVIYPTPMATENAQGRLCDTTLTIHCLATS